VDFAPARPTIADHRKQHVAAGHLIIEVLDEVGARRNVVDVEEDLTLAEVRA
jgi:hypothetical protein